MCCNTPQCKTGTDWYFCCLSVLTSLTLWVLMILQLQCAASLYSAAQLFSVSHWGQTPAVTFHLLWSAGVDEWASLHYVFCECFLISRSYNSYFYIFTVDKKTACMWRPLLVVMSWQKVNTSTAAVELLQSTEHSAVLVHSHCSRSIISCHSGKLTVC